MSAVRSMNSMERDNVKATSFFQSAFGSPRVVFNLRTGVYQNNCAIRSGLDILWLWYQRWSGFRSGMWHRRHPTRCRCRLPLLFAKSAGTNAEFLVCLHDKLLPLHRNLHQAQSAPLPLFQSLLLLVSLRLLEHHEQVVALEALGLLTALKKRLRQANRTCNTFLSWTIHTGTRDREQRTKFISIPR